MKNTKVLYYIFHDSAGGKIGENTYDAFFIQNLDIIIQLDGVDIISEYRVHPINQSSQINYNFRLSLNFSTKIEKT